MIQQLKLFLTAIMFITRIPVPKWVGYSETNLNQCNRYFPLVGIVVGSIGALVYWAAHFIFPSNIAVILSMVSTVITTGGFHEDGFADVCDGFGGGWTKDKILTIMKDSRVGAFGMIGTILILLLKYAALSAIPSSLMVITVISGHAISRAYAVSTMYTLAYVREDELSKSKPVTKNLHKTDFFIAIVIGLLPLVGFGNWQIFLCIVPLTITKLWLDIYFKKWIGGYVGDCLGSMQQVTEVIFYLSIIALGTLIEKGFL